MGRLAVVRTPLGLYLIGGGVEGRETPRQTIVREAFEEGGLIVRAGDWSLCAVQLSYSVSDRVYYEKLCTFVEATPEAVTSSGSEADHELQWIALDDAARLLTDESHRWAVAEWTAREE